MFARRKDFWYKRMAVRQLLFCLTLLAFLCRAAIPVGYMPDLSGKSESTFAITLCSPSGTAVMLLDMATQHGDPASDFGYVDQGCPFGLNIAEKVLPGGPMPALAGIISFLYAAPRLSTWPAALLHSQGPPLGSRAPPARFV